MMGQHLLSTQLHLPLAAHAEAGGGPFLQAFAKEVSSQAPGKQLLLHEHALPWQHQLPHCQMVRQQEMSDRDGGPHRKHGHWHL